MAGRIVSELLQKKNCIYSLLKFRTLKMSVNPEGPISTTITKKLTETFLPLHMDIINESYMHNVPKGSETHFKVVIVSEKFKEMKNLIARHRAVNETLAEELSSGVHALSIVAKTPEQWEKMAQNGIEPSPKCRGGFGK